MPPRQSSRTQSRPPAKELGILLPNGIQLKGLHLKNRHIYIDFENVQPKELALLKGRDFRVMIFVGATQAKLPTEFAIAVQALGPAAEYVQIAGSGRNALDFHIAYYLGRTSVDTSTGECFVVSKDTGFDPLLRHLKAKGVSCQRVGSIGAIPGLKETATKPDSDPIQRVLANLAKRAAAKPRTVKALRSSIKHLLGTQGTEETVDRLMGELEGLNAIRTADGKVTYPTT